MDFNEAPGQSNISSYSVEPEVHHSAWRVTVEVSRQTESARRANDALEAELDATLASAERLLQGNGDSATSSTQSDPRLMIYDPDWDEDARLSEWRDLM